MKKISLIFIMFSNFVYGQNFDAIYSSYQNVKSDPICSEWIKENEFQHVFDMFLINDFVEESARNKTIAIVIHHFAGNCTDFEKANDTNYPLEKYTSFTREEINSFFKNRNQDNEYLVSQFVNNQYYLNLIASTKPTHQPLKKLKCVGGQGFFAEEYSNGPVSNYIDFNSFSSWFKKKYTPILKTSENPFESKRLKEKYEMDVTNYNRLKNQKLIKISKFSRELKTFEAGMIKKYAQNIDCSSGNKINVNFYLFNPTLVINISSFNVENFEYKLSCYYVNAKNNNRFCNEPGFSDVIISRDGFESVPDFNTQSKFNVFLKFKSLQEAERFYLQASNNNIFAFEPNKFTASSKFHSKAIKHEVIKSSYCFTCNENSVYPYPIFDKSFEEQQIEIISALKTDLTRILNIKPGNIYMDDSIVENKLMKYKEDEDKINYEYRIKAEKEALERKQLEQKKREEKAMLEAKAEKERIYNAKMQKAREAKAERDMIILKMELEREAKLKRNDNEANRRTIVKEAKFIQSERGVLNTGLLRKDEVPLLRNDWKKDREIAIHIGTDYIKLGNKPYSLFVIVNENRRTYYNAKTWDLYLYMKMNDSSCVAFKCKTPDPRSKRLEFTPEDYLDINKLRELLVDMN